MDASIETVSDGRADLAPASGGRLRRLFTGRRGLVLLALAVIAAGLALSWEWLVAVGVAPLLIALAPCAAMCALGLCMSRMGNKSCSTKSTTEPAGQSTSAETVRTERTAGARAPGK